MPIWRNAVSVKNDKLCVLSCPCVHSPYLPKDRITWQENQPQTGSGGLSQPPRGKQRKPQFTPGAVPGTSPTPTCVQSDSRKMAQDLATGSNSTSLQLNGSLHRPMYLIGICHTQFYIPKSLLTFPDR